MPLPAVRRAPEGAARSGEETRLEFLDIAASAGVVFVHENGARGRRHMPETTVGGAGWIDADGDRRLDLYLVNGNEHSDRGGAGRVGNRLYRNLGAGRFEDVTEYAGVGDRGYGVGLAVGDYDNDGRSDLYVTNLGANVLYHNEGEGRFRDVTGEAGVGGGEWSSSAAFFDADGDGRLDLWVCNYVDYDPTRRCETQGRHSYCSPRTFSGVADRLYRNLGDGRFEDVSEAAGIAIAGAKAGKSLGVIVFDPDRDGDQDIYIACDQVPNLLFRNQGNMRFEEVGNLANVAYSADGLSQAGMGVDAGDIDLDGREDLVVTNFADESNAYYRSEGDFFEEVSQRSGLSAATLPMLGFGIVLFDADLDSDLDVYVGNGHVLDNASELRASDRFAQSDQLLENLDGERFRDVSASSGDWFQRALVSRSVATADFDEDGDEDLVVSSCAGPVALLRNESSGAYWIAFDLEGRASNRDGYGARLEITFTRRGRREVRVATCRSARSFASACDPRLRFGLGRRAPSTEAPDKEAPRVERVEISWPSGRVQELLAPQIDRVHLVVEPAP